MTVSRRLALTVFAILLVLGLISCSQRGLDVTTPTAASSPVPSSTIVNAASPTSTAIPSPVSSPVARLAAPLPSPVKTATAVSTPLVTPSPVSTVAAPNTDATAIPSPPPRDLIDLLRRLKPIATSVATPTGTSLVNYPVGSRHTFWVANQDAKNYFQMTARIVAKTDHTYWYVQDGTDLPATDVQDAASYFENKTYRVEHSLFGSEWTPGIDNDVHITILVGQVPGVGGYFSTADEYPRSVNPYSNQREMIYINVDSVRPGSPGFNGTVAHEFMHMIQFNVHRWQNSWIDEGSAELAAQAVTGAASGALRSFEARPSTQLNAWASEPADATPHYGAAYLFMRYVSEQFGGFQAVGQVIAEPYRGIESFDHFFRSQKQPRTFDQVFADWVAANALNDRALAGGRYGYSGLRVSPLTQPGPVPGGSVRGDANQFGTTYYRINAASTETITFSGSTMTRLIGADPHGGRYEWWSNRGDSIDSRLTRAVDLRGVNAATLKFWSWYDIEQDFDYAYVEASSDGGKSWLTLPTSQTTTSNPNGQNYGNGLTGTSGGDNASWVQQTVDLSRFAHQQILLRFEYVTDDSFNADGLALDDVEIPEIGLRDDASADDGWQSDGFVRIDNHWPQTYLVEVLSRSGATPAQRLQLGTDQRGTLRIGPGSYIVAIAGMAPITTHSAPYVLGVSPN